MSDKETNRQAPKRGEYALLALIAGALTGWAVIIVYALASETTLSVFGVASMVAASSMLGGAFFGFIFGVPRTLQRSGEEEGTDTKGRATNESKSAPPKESKSASYRPNTNLEQISDWLTKILVGAGLTQITAIRQWLWDVSNSLAPGFGSSKNARVFATVTVLSYLLDGFLIGYLWTRLYLAGALQEADVESLAQEVKEIREQTDLDAKALSLLTRQLNPSAGVTPPSQQEVNDAVSDASESVKAQIFYQAATMRSENWLDPAKKAKMERTIPLFRALIASDKDDEYHRNHGQLGYALKDQRTPDWASAEAELTKAITIRGSGLEHNWVWYEFCRAVCRIKTDDNFKQGKKSSAEVRKRIIEDLQVAGTDDYAKEAIPNDQMISDWTELNEVQPSELHK